MRVTITIEQEDEDDAEPNLGISAVGADPMAVFKLVMAGAEMVAYDMVRQSLIDNGTDEETASFAAPLRTRLLALEILTLQPITPYDWVHLDLSPGLT